MWEVRRVLTRPPGISVQDNASGGLGKVPEAVSAGLVVEGLGVKRQRTKDGAAGPLGSFS